MRVADLGTPADALAQGEAALVGQPRTEGDGVVYAPFKRVSTSQITVQFPDLHQQRSLLIGSLRRKMKGSSRRNS